MSHPIDKLGFPPWLASSSSWAWLFGGIAQDVIDHDGSRSATRGCSATSSAGEAAC